MKQKKAVKKKSTVGSIPQSAPLVKACMTSGFSVVFQVYPDQHQGSGKGHDAHQSGGGRELFPDSRGSQNDGSAPDTLINKCMIFFFQEGLFGFYWMKTILPHFTLFFRTFKQVCPSIFIWRSSWCRFLFCH
ncbi:MAG: hypothetical protein R2860_03145 [Desulfobacterales bacterium]